MVQLDYRDARPIYTQVVDGFREQIAAGGLQQGDRLPSVRELACQLTINPNTIQRAYRELEHLGLISTVAGKGAFASADGDGAGRRKRELLDEMAALLRELRLLGATEEEIRQALLVSSGEEDSE